MSEMDDDDPILLPGGEIHTVGEARADRKLERRINFANFMRSGLRDKLVRILQRPALDRRGQLWVLRENAVALALGAFDKIEELERRRRSKGGKNHGPKVRTNTTAKYEKEWGGYTCEEKVAILDYCQSDVDALARLLPRMLPGILARPHGLQLALLRGLYSGHAIAAMEHSGTPIDRPTWMRLRQHWDEIKARLVAQVDSAFGIYDGLVFKMERFVNYLSRNNLPWPQLASGDPDMKDQTFKEMGELYPQVEPLRQLRHTLSQLRPSDLAVGPDDRNRCMLGQFVASTGRNAPKASQYIFGPSTWLSGLIKPEPGRALAHIDWSSQEIGIAALCPKMPIYWTRSSVAIPISTSRRWPN